MERLFKTYKRKFIIFVAVCAAVLITSYVATVISLPDRITILEGEEYVYHFKSPFFVSVKANKKGVVSLYGNKETIEREYLSLSNPISLKSRKHGSVSLRMRVFGLIPLKTVQVDVVPNKSIIACGNTVGVRLDIQGVLVLGISDVETQNGKRTTPAKNSGIRQGDLLIGINDKKLDNIGELIKEIDKSRGGRIKIRYKHGNNVNETYIKPEISAEDEKFHIGLWVRDSTAGIGTLTFYDPTSGCFGALGHGVADIDTGIIMPVASGEILESNILAVKKGQQGSPGELKGVFIEDRSILGVIKKNCEHGIYGILGEGAENRLNGRLLPVGLRSQVKEGPAVILANVDEKHVNEYSIVIQKVLKQNINGSKGMMIKITDKRLLNETGGIVQGMSGSPIIQNGRIIGAVTHVLISKPDTGYGIFIETMLKNMVDQDRQNLDKAG